MSKGLNHIAPLNGSMPMRQSVFDFSEAQKSQVAALLQRLALTDTEPFIENLELIIAEYRAVREHAKVRVADKARIAAIKQLHGKTVALMDAIKGLAPQTRTILGFSLQIDDYQTGRFKPGEDCPDNLPEIHKKSFHFVRAVRGEALIDKFFQTLEEELSRLQRISRTGQVVKDQRRPQGGRPPLSGPAQLANAVATAYQEHFNQSPPTTRDGPYEQLVKLAGEHAGFVIENWHDVIVNKRELEQDPK